MTDLSPLAAQSARLATAGALPQIGGNADPTRIEAIARDFEAVFLARMLQPMFADVEPEEPFGGGFAEDVWRGFMAEELGKSMAAAGGIGLADTVAREMLRLQDQAVPPGLEARTRIAR